MTNPLAHWTLYLLSTHAAAEEGGFMHYILESNVINIVLAALVLGFLVKKFNLLAGIDTQQRKVAETVETTERQRAEALAQLEEAKRRTANLNAEVEEILKNAKESAEALSSQILADARTESAKIVENAKKRVELEQRAAAKELERRLLNDALSDAREELTQSLSSNDRARSVESFLDELKTVKGGH